MIKKLLQAAIVVAGGLALGGCPLEQAKTTAPANKPPAADYQAAARGRAARRQSAPSATTTPIWRRTARACCSRN